VLSTGSFCMELSEERLQLFEATRVIERERL
jgi:hypothetical protein